MKDPLIVQVMENRRGVDRRTYWGPRKYSEHDVRWMRAAYKGGVGVKGLCVLYRNSYQAIYNIVKGYTYQHVTEKLSA